MTKIMPNDRIFEISGNLSKILNYDNFEKTICIVRNRFINLFGEEIMSRIPLLVDNATQMSGYTPITTPVFGKYLCIKLGILNFLCTEQIIFQFSHELCHFVFYSLQGFNKPNADDREESICTAMSLCILKDLNNGIQQYIDYDNGLDYLGYRNGAAIAEAVNYDSNLLSSIILSGISNVWN